MSGHISPTQVIEPSATPGNLPIYDAYGHLVDSGSAPASGITYPGDATKYLDGTGAFTVPAGGGGGGGWSLLESHSASSSASVAFTSRNASGQSGVTFQSDFDIYKLEIYDFTVATTGAFLVLNFSSNGGSSWITTGYTWRYINWDNTAQGELGNNGDTWIACCPGHTTNAVMLSATFYNPLSTSFYKGFNWQFTGVLNGSQRLAAVGGGLLENSATACNSFKIFTHTAVNIATGKFKLYGM